MPIQAMLLDDEPLSPVDEIPENTDQFTIEEVGGLLWHPHKEVECHDFNAARERVIGRVVQRLKDRIEKGYVGDYITAMVKGVCKKVAGRSLEEVGHLALKNILSEMYEVDFFLTMFLCKQAMERDNGGIWRFEVDGKKYGIRVGDIPIVAMDGAKELRAQGQYSPDCEYETYVLQHPYRIGDEELTQVVVGPRKASHWFSHSFDELNSDRTILILSSIVGNPGCSAKLDMQSIAQMKSVDLSNIETIMKKREVNLNLDIEVPDGDGGTKSISMPWARSFFG